MTEIGGLLTWAIVIHLIADWIMQNNWMAKNKVSLTHPAAWIHSGIHALMMTFLFPWWIALFVGITHMLIDTRVPFRLWVEFYGQTKEGPYAVPVAVWVDQVFHIAVLSIAVIILGAVE